MMGRMFGRSRGVARIGWALRRHRSRRKASALPHPASSYYRSAGRSRVVRGPQVRGFQQRRVGGYSFYAADTINTYGNVRSLFGGNNVYRDHPGRPADAVRALRPRLLLRFRHRRPRRLLAVSQLIRPFGLDDRSSNGRRSHARRRPFRVPIRSTQRAVAPTESRVHCELSPSVCHAAVALNPQTSKCAP